MLREMLEKGTKAQIAGEIAKMPPSRQKYKKGDSTGRMLTVLGVCCQSPGVPATVPCNEEELSILETIVIRLKLQGIQISRATEGKVNVVSNFRGVRRENGGN